MKNTVSICMLLAATCLVTGCASTLTRFENIGKAPPMAEITDPTSKPDYKPLSWPLPETPGPQKKHANSLWQPGARAFYRDGRASRVGDILRVTINIRDQAEFNNNTVSTRKTAENAAVPSFLGLAGKLLKPLPGKADANNLLDITGSNDHEGNVVAKRKETVQTQVAAMVTQVLPNGNFVISGKQEFLMNFDIREVSVQGVVRPADIKSDNSVDSTQVAEARIIYGGRGQNMDVQQRRWGSQAADILSPF